MSARLLFIDTETGGLDATLCSLLSLGLVVWENGEMLGSMELFIAEPEILIETEAQLVHGLTIEKLRACGISPAEAVARIEAFLAQHFILGTAGAVPLAGHNVGFDIAFLRRLYRLGGRDYDRIFSHRTLDTAGILRFLVIAGLLPLEGAGSTAAFDHFGITFGDHARHSALGDAEATAILFTKLVALVQHASRESLTPISAAH